MVTWRVIRGDTTGALFCTPVAKVHCTEGSPTSRVRGRVSREREVRFPSARTKLTLKEARTPRDIWCFDQTCCVSPTSKQALTNRLIETGDKGEMDSADHPLD